MSVFETKSANAESTAALLEAALPLMGEDGRIPWSKVEALTGIKYSRGWLIVRRAYLEAQNPEVLVNISGLTSAAMAKYGSEFDLHTHVVEPVVRNLRDEQQLSWGEIAVRCGMPEGAIRKAYRRNGTKKDLGLRIGRGGRFAYDEGTYYQDNRRKEGAHIPTTVKMRPKVEELLNYVPPTATPVKRVRKVAKAS